MARCLGGLGLALSFALGVKGLGGVLSSRFRTSSRVGGFAMAKSPSRKPIKVSKETIYRLYPLLPRQGQIKGFYEAVGRAITSWQAVEFSLREVLVAAAAPQMPGVLWAAFGAIHTAANKARVVGASIRFFCFNEQALQKRWNTLYNTFTDLDDRRNHFAHFAASIEFSQPKKDMRIILTSRIPLR
jgi:hypothetical protein